MLFYHEILRADPLLICRWWRHHQPFGGPAFRTVINIAKLYGVTTKIFNAFHSTATVRRNDWSTRCTIQRSISLVVRYVSPEGKVYVSKILSCRRTPGCLNYATHYYNEGYKDIFFKTHFVLLLLLKSVVYICLLHLWVLPDGFWKVNWYKRYLVWVLKSSDEWYESVIFKTIGQCQGF